MSGKLNRILSKLNRILSGAVFRRTPHIVWSEVGVGHGVGVGVGWRFCFVCVGSVTLFLGIVRGCGWSCVCLSGRAFIFFFLGT